MSNLPLPCRLGEKHGPLTKPTDDGTFPFHVTISSSPLILQVPLFWAFPKFLSSSWPSHQVRETEAAT